MPKMVYTIDDKMYLIDEDTGTVKTIIIQSESIPAREYEKILKYIFQNRETEKNNK